MLFNISYSIYQVFLSNMINFQQAVCFQMTNNNITKKKLNYSIQPTD